VKTSIAVNFLKDVLVTSFLFSKLIAYFKNYSYFISIITPSFVKPYQ